MNKLSIYELDINIDTDKTGTLVAEMQAEDFHYLIKAIHNWVDEDDAFVAGYLTATYFTLKSNRETRSNDWCYKGWRFVVSV